jgi:hypothetical protein
MRWELIQSTPEHEIYHLFKDDKKILTLELNPFSNSARVECNNEKRVFLIRKEGLRRNKTVIRSEYGIKIGELGHDNKEKFIDVNDQRFYFTSQKDSADELVLYKESKATPLVSCALDVSKGAAGVKFSKDPALNGNPHPGLLMALCWYMFLPATREKVSEIAVS